jgi:hypothetical protein
MELSVIMYKSVNRIELAQDVILGENCLEMIFGFYKSGKFHHWRSDYQLAWIYTNMSPQFTFI